MKTRFTKCLAMLLTICMVVCMAACGQTSDQQGSSEASSKSTESSSQTGISTSSQASSASTSDAEVDGQLILDYEEELEYATKFTLTRYKGGYSMFTIPEAMGETQYLIVPENKSVPADLSENTVVLQQPLNKIASAVTAGVSLIDAIDGLDHIAAVATKQEDWYLQNVVSKMEKDEIKYMGSYSEPDFELLMSLGVQVEFDSTMILNKPEIMDKYKEIGIPCIVDYSSKEEHLLGRVEWIKLYGALMGMDEEATKYFDSQVEKVSSVSNLAKTGKTAVMYYKSKDTYYVRNAGDYVVSMLNLAGGESIAPEVGAGKGGSTKMNAEEFYATCSNADYVFQVVFECPYSTIEEMIEYDSIFADFKAVKEGNVYTTRQGFSQSSSILADVVVEINQVLNDPSIEKTENLIKITGASQTADDVDGELIFDHTEELEYAVRFSIDHYKGGYSIFKVGSMEGKEYLLVPEGKSVPEGLSENTVVLQKPINKITLASSSILSLADAIGGLDKVATVAKKEEDWYIGNVAAEMRAGNIKFSGKYSQPDFELMLQEGIQLEIDTGMLAKKTEVMDKYNEVGIPFFIDDASNEEHVLGRVEWVKLFGEITDMQKEADAYFEEQKKIIEDASSSTGTGKTGALYYFSSDTYQLRNDGDYLTSLLKLAGGENIAANIGVGEGGATKMDAETFYATCKDADYLFWVYIECPYESLDEMIKENPLFADFKAVKEGNVYATKDGFSQSVAVYANTVAEMNSILNDPTIEKTENLFKLK